MEKIIIQNKIDIMQSIIDVRRDLGEIHKAHFSLGSVTKESWEASPSAGVRFHKSKIPMLKAAGVMKDPKDYEYGWHFPNAHYAKSISALAAADKLLAEISCYLKDYRLSPKKYRFSEAEKSLFQVIEGGCRDSWLMSRLKGVVVNG